MHDTIVKYPDLPVEIITYFSKDPAGRERNVWKFCDEYSKKNDLKTMIQPSMVVKVCEILVSEQKLSNIRREGIDGMNNSYFCSIRADISNIQIKNHLNIELSMLIGGFLTIYDIYKNLVKPIQFIKKNDDRSLGTCFFLMGNRIITARHCIEGASGIAIRDIDLKNAKIYFHQNDNIDLAMITVNATSNLSPKIGKGRVLDEVITLGFPQTAGFHNFVVVETAQVSSRFSATKGNIVGKGKEIFSKVDLFLINARIKGGNSGGPVLNHRGEIIGVSIQQNYGEGYYDDLGYGTVVPIQYAFDGLLDLSIAQDVTVNYNLSGEFV